MFHVCFDVAVDVTIVKDYRSSLVPVTDSHCANY